MVDPRLAQYMTGNTAGQVVDPSYAGGRAMQDWLSNPYNLQMLAGVAQAATGGQSPQGAPPVAQSAPSAPLSQRKPEYDGSTQDSINRELAQRQGGQSAGDEAELVDNPQEEKQEQAQAPSGGPGWLDEALLGIATGAAATMPRAMQTPDPTLPAPDKITDTTFEEVKDPALNKPSSQLTDQKLREQSGPTIKSQDGTPEPSGKTIRGGEPFDKAKATPFNHGGNTYYLMPGKGMVYNEAGTQLGSIAKIAPSKANMLMSLTKRAVR